MLGQDFGHREELAKVASGAFTEPIGVIDKERFFKHKLSK